MTTNSDLTDEAVAARAIASGAVMADRAAAWITARHLLTGTAKPLPTDVLALALWLTGDIPADDEDDASTVASAGAPESSLDDERAPIDGDFGPVQARR